MNKIIYFLLFIVTTTFSQQRNIFDIARNGKLAEVEQAYKTDPNCINSINENKSSPLILACYRGNTEVAYFLMEHINDINYNSGMGTALMATVVNGNVTLAEALINKKANINLTDVQGTTALMFAVQFKNIKMIQLLLAKNADKTIVNKNGKTAFEYAAFGGDEQIINLLK